MVDEVLLLRKISEVEGYLGQVSEYKNIHLDEYQNDWKIQRIFCPIKKPLLTS